ncbi:MAG: HlyD family efflux transporter periplasmic adaptor subunit [Verrucomicrobia bacterium]|nr:HlyD family efflux transporter periplasmic adaptor subunit [Verrucomicrobiota bacterium]
MEKLQSTLRKLRILIVAMTAGFALLVAALLALVKIDEKVPAVGVVLAERESYLYAPEDGLIETIHAYDAATVREGDPILTLDCRDQENLKTRIEAELKEATASFELKQAQLEKIAKLPLPKEFWHARSELSEAEQKLRHAALELKRYQQLLDEKLASQSDFDARKLAYDLEQAELMKVRDRVAVLDKGLEETIKKEALAELNTATARLERLKADLQVCQDQMERRKIRAPMGGRMTFLAKRRPGENVLKGDELAHICGGEANRARLLVGEAQVHRVKPGQRVRMKSNVFEFMRYGYIEAHVEEVALEPYARSPAEANRAGAYRVMAKIDKTPVPLVLGSSLEARIILRQIALWRLLLPRQ